MNGIHRLIDMNEQLCSLIIEKDKIIEWKQFTIKELECNILRYEVIIDQKDSEIDKLETLLCLNDAEYNDDFE